MLGSRSTFTNHAPRTHRQPACAADSPVPMAKIHVNRMACAKMLADNIGVRAVPTVVGRVPTA